MTSQTIATATDIPAVEMPQLQLNRNWAGAWALLTAFVIFEVIKHGFVGGGAMYGVSLALIAVGSFIAPDLTFLVGLGDVVEKGSMSKRAVPFYNGAHRMVAAASFTALAAGAMSPAVFIGGLSWMAHIAMDRAVGYGLRNPDGSRSQH